MFSSRWTAALVIGAALCFVFVVLGVVDVATDQGSCGTGFAPGWNEDVATDTACTAAMADRRRLMLLTGVPGFLLVGIAAVAALVSRRRSSSPAGSG